MRAMNELTRRQQTLLLLIIRDYIDAAQPVGSKWLTEHYHLDFSPATIRNEMAALTEMGFLRQPHTSAGRVPTEEGYRFFVSQMMNQAELPVAVRHTISHQFLQAQPGLDQWMQLAASVLANQSQGVSVVTAPRPEKVRFQHVELIATQGRQVLMVLVLIGGEVLQQILTLAEVVFQDRLSQTAARLNGILMGLSADDLAALATPADALDQDILTLIMTEMRRASAGVSSEVYTDGLTHVLSEPEFNESDEARRTLRLFVEPAAMQNMLQRALADSSVGGLQVLIGGEGGWAELRQCSMVLARYGVPGLATGSLGVVGPMRMPYTKAIPTVRYVAGLLSNFVNDQIVGE